MNRLAGLCKLLHTALHVVGGLLTILLLFPALDSAQRQLRVQRWSAAMLSAMGVQLKVDGRIQHAGPLMVVANHISWLDITALHSVQFCRFVAKADIKHWPVIGGLADRSGTLFIERASSRDALRVVHHMADSLRAGDVLAVFPEGTTSDGTALLPFHANLFQAAVSANAPVQPVLIQYLDRRCGQSSQAPNYVGEEHFLTSVWRTLCTPGLVAHIRLGAPQAIDSRDRRALAAQLRDAVAALRPSQ
jgi:1-acyl-sn-glycerol-3-phosphate acyltransferase